MTFSELKNRAYELCLQTGRLEIIPDIASMDVATVNGLISYLLSLQS